MEIKDIAGLILNVVATIVAVIALIESHRTAKRQAEQQGESKREQLIRGTCEKLSTHLTTWHDALRAAVRSNDSQRMKDFEESLNSFANNLKEVRIQLESFRGGEEYEGPLEPILANIADFPECRKVIESVKYFQREALEFKEGASSATLMDMVTGDGHWSETKRTDPREYERQKEEGLEIVRNAYKAAMIEIGRVIKKCSK